MSQLELHGIPLPNGWRLDPATIRNLYRMDRHKIAYVANIWAEAEALVATHYHRKAVGQ